MSESPTAHRLGSFLGAIDPGTFEWALELARHAALPAALDADLLHLIRVNFVPDAPIECEAHLLLSPLCRTVGDDLYEIDSDTRRELLADLVHTYGVPRLQELAQFLGQFLFRSRAGWLRRHELLSAQLATALQYLDPPRVQAWLALAEASAGQTQPLERAWYVALRRELEQIPPPEPVPEGPQTSRQALAQTVLEALKDRRSILIEGPAGRGKSWLMRHIAALLDRRRDMVPCLLDAATIGAFDPLRCIAMIWQALRPHLPGLPWPEPLRLRDSPDQVTALQHYLTSITPDPQSLTQTIGQKLAAARSPVTLVFLVDGLDEIAPLTELERQVVEPLYRSPQVRVIAARRSHVYGALWTTFVLRSQRRDEAINVGPLPVAEAEAQINSLFAGLGATLAFADLRPLCRHYAWQNPGANRHLAAAAIANQAGDGADLISAREVRACIRDLSRSNRLSEPITDRDVDWLIAVVRRFPTIGAEDVPTHRLNEPLAATAGRPVGDGERNEWLGRLQERGIVVRRSNGLCLVHEEFAGLCLDWAVMSHSGTLLAPIEAVVGREAELATLRDAIFPQPQRAFRSVVISGAPGVGKTSLVQEISRRLHLGPAEGRTTWAAPAVIALPVIDVQDPLLHTLPGFLQTVRRHIAQALPGRDDAFAQFDNAWLQYEAARDGALDYATVNARTEELARAFERDYAALTHELRVVWLLDTLEHLYAVPPEIAEYFDALTIGGEALGWITYSWILQFTARLPGNTTMIFAGRPTTDRWMAAISARIPAESSVALAIHTFSLAQTAQYIRHYFDSLTQNAAWAERAGDLRAYFEDPNWITNLHRLSEGSPLLLSMYIGLFLDADTIPEALGDPTLVERLDNTEIRDLRDRLDADLLRYLTLQLTDPESQVLGYLSVMRRGLDRDRLKMLWGVEDDAAIDQVFASLQRFTFIKVSGGTLFLHDEVYSIYQRNLSRLSLTEQSAERERRHDIFSRLVAYNERRTLEIVQHIDRLQEPLLTRDPADPNDLNIQAQLRALRAERRRARIERVHYALYDNPAEGLNRAVFQVAGEAFLANEPDIEELLQSEVAAFFFGGAGDLSHQQADSSPEGWQLLRFHVLHERVSRWIRRLILLGRHEQAQALARAASDTHRDQIARHYPDLGALYDQPDEALLGDLFRDEWAACRCFAAIYAGRNLQILLAELAEITGRLKTALSGAALRQPRFKDFRWRLRNLLAECLHFQGFARVNLYEFKVAEDFYREANRILEETQFKTLQSDVQNGLARVLGERGNLSEALALCEEALRVREQYGFDYLRGLSRNTLALINTRNARPTRALEHATAALTIFRQLGNPRGIGLALVQVAEARRRVWNFTAEEIANDPVARSRIDSDLLEAVEPLLDEAEELFTHRLPSEARLVEIWIEKGSLYRDWASFFGLPQAQAEFATAEKSYTQAIERSAQDTYRYPQHYLAACVNLAWLYARAGQHDRAMLMATQAKEFVSPAYRFSTDRPVDANAPNVTNFRELSKIYILLARELLPPQSYAERLREYIFAVTAMQLFSPYDSYYLVINKRQLSSYVRRTFKTIGEREQLLVLTEAIIRNYHLQPLAAVVKSLQAEAVIREAARDQDDERPSPGSGR